MKALDAAFPKFWAEARAIMDRHDLPEESFEAVRHDLLMKAYQQEAEPFIKYITRCGSLAMPTYVYSEGEVSKKDDGLPEHLREAIAEARAHISALQVKWFGVEAWRKSLA